MSALFPRKSRDGPVVTKRVSVTNGGGNKSNVMISLSDDFQPTNLVEEKPIPKPRRKRVDMKISKSLPGASGNKLQVYSTKQDTVQHKPIPSKEKATRSLEYLGKTENSLEYGYSDHNNQRTQNQVKKNRLSKSVKLDGSKDNIELSTEYISFAANQAYELNETFDQSITQNLLSSVSSRNVTFDSTGNKKVNLSSDFQEYSISTLKSLSDPNLTYVSQRENSEKLKEIRTKGSVISNTTYSEDFEDHSFNALKNLHEVSDVALASSQSRLRPVTSHVSFVDGTKNLTYSSDFENYSKSIEGIHSAREFYSETDIDTLTKSHDKPVTSWVEVKDGKKVVKYSDDFESFSPGSAIQYTNTGGQPKKNLRDIYKKVEYKDGKRHVSYSDEFLNSICSEYSDDFENSNSSWAVKVTKSPVTKRVEYVDGIKHVSYTSDLENTLLEADYTDDFETIQSFKEISIEDIEDQSYTEDFESFTAKGQSFARSVPSELSIDEDTELWTNGTHSKATSICTSIHPKTHDTAETLDHNMKSDLYSESYETITSLPRSEQSGSVQHSEEEHRQRKRHTESEAATETEEDYSLTFSADEETLEKVITPEETPEMKRASQSALRSFVTRKLQSLKKPKPKKDVTFPQEEKLAGLEGRHFNNFLKKKIKLLENKKNGVNLSENASSSKRKFASSVRCQIRGISPTEPVEHYGISSSVIARLRLENTVHNVKEAAAQEVHDPNKCQHCSEKMAQVAAENFMWHKKAIVSEKLVQEKTEMQILQLQNPMWLYAEALKGLPKVTDNREQVYDKLMRPLYDSYAVNATLNYQDSF